MYGYDQTAYGSPHGQPGQPGHHQHGQGGAPGPHEQSPYGGQNPGAGYGDQGGYPQQAGNGYGTPDTRTGRTGAGGAAPAAPSLADALRAYVSGGLSTEEFQDVFWGAKVYCPRGENPGFLAVQTTQEPVIPLFTSLRELRRYAGKESRYFTVTGGEVLDLLPAGYGFALDMEGEHRIVLDAKAVVDMTDYAMRRVYG
ncbi:SseB family protein [Streptomyces alkaliphilus]|uniref:SseB family protein n=1 Tax=Streptomyces alkaliphilus TaxID=1472722 RepID=UPI0011810FAD|nr:SseB family protein [Streptomyces alkaliphilus]MQS08351.1 SseB family protein [Streptomyces alkaliphilus]